MPRITHIKPQKDKSRFNIYLDGKFAFGLDALVIVGENLKTGQEISLEEAQALIAANELQKYMDRVFNFLSYRPRSKKEIIDYLARKKVGGETEKVILQKLTRLNYIDDLAFAKWWLEQRQTFRPEGKRLLKLELKRKGISDEIIAEVLSTGPELDSEQLARQVLKKKLARFQKLPYKEAFNKALSLLLRRGFDYETVKGVIEKELKKE